ncbi:MAG: HlyD family efflux transporter periplasmic adaptor subunit [Pseudomonadales bacterium]|nr:HlyD family efflux transporter periplasmic adaptor subunit [Pseudomonadales bacterium]
MADTKIEGTAGQDVYVGTPPSRSRNLKIVVFGLLLGLLGWLFATYLYGFFVADDYFESAKVRSADVQRGDFERAISVEGNVVATFNPMLYAQDSGVIALHVDEGSSVKTGASLAIIDNPELTSELKRQESALELLKVELDTLINKLAQQDLQAEQSLTLLKINLGAEQRELERMSKIVEQGSIALNDYEKIKDRVHSLEVQIENTVEQNRLTSEVRAYEVRTKELTIEQQALLVSDLQRQVNLLHMASPVDGVVGDIQVNERDTVARNQPILNVVDLSSYQVEVLIPETYAESLKVGLPARIDYRNKEHEGSLVSISPEVKLGSVTARVEFASTAPGGLRQNLRLNTKIVLEAKENVLKVKRGPFVEAHAGRGAYVLNGDLAEYRRIRLGALSITEVEILQGVEENETLIISDTAELMGSQTVLITD